MAELVILPHADHPRYGEGDILCAFSDDRIGEVHAAHLCVGALAERFDALGYRYRFSRVSRTEIVRTDLMEGTPDVLYGPLPNAAGESIDVEAYLAGRQGRRVFGTPDREIWYGGHWQLDVEAIWAEIEAHTPFRRVDYRRWPLGTDEYRHFLAISVDDAPDELVEPLTNGDPDTPVVVQPRAYAIDWRAHILPRLTGVTERDVLDRDIPIDIRDLLFARDAIVRRKVCG